jgi:hypothetical protein
MKIDEKFSSVFIFERGWSVRFHLGFHLFMGGLDMSRRQSKAAASRTRSTTWRRLENFFEKVGG